MGKNNEVRGKHAKHAKQDSGEKTVAADKPSSATKGGDAAASARETVRIEAVKGVKPAPKEVQGVAGNVEKSVKGNAATQMIPKGPSKVVPAQTAPKPASQPAKNGSPKETPPLAPLPSQTPPLAPLPNGATTVIPAQSADPQAWTPIVDPSTLHKPHTARNVGIALALIVGVLAVAYAAGAIYFGGHFYPGTALNNQNISLMNGEEVAQVIEQTAADYQVEVSGSGMDFVVSSQDMGIQVDGERIAKEALAENNVMQWPYEMTQPHDITDHLVTEYNSAGLGEYVTAQVDAWNEEAEDPVDASLVYSEESLTYEIIPEQPGTKFDAQSVLSVVDEAVANMEPTAQLSEDQLLKPAVLSDNETLLAAQQTANNYVQADLHLILGESSEVAEINADQISQWVTFDGDMNVTFDDETMDAWLTDLGNSFDTVGSERTYTRPDGKTVTIDGGTYGWEVDTASMVDIVHQEIMNGTQGDVLVPWIAGAAFYNGPGQVDWSDYIDVDLSEQHAYYITGAGEVIWESDTVTGMPDGKHDTPPGIWTLFSMESPAVLKGEIQATTGAPEYETQVQYWMPFTYSGCGLHDATWQPAFGGSLYSQGYGSHGCVNLSYDAAESLFNIAVVGIPVIVHW